MNKIILGIESIIKQVLSAMILVIRPIMGCPGCCRYSFSCTDYALFMLEHERLLPALNLIIRRVLSCNPFTKQEVFDTPDLAKKASSGTQTERKKYPIRSC